MSVEKKILNHLIDKYESSKSFANRNKVNQRFQVKVTKLLPKYEDQSDYDTFSNINESINFLHQKGYIEAKVKYANVYDSIYLNTQELDNIYTYLNRTPKKDINEELIQLLNEYKDKNSILKEFCHEQLERIEENKKVKYFSDDLKEFKNILRAVSSLFTVEKETFLRDFSIQVFRDSKLFEQISSKVTSLLYEYGDFPERDSILEGLNIVKNPTYVNFKGQGSITISGQIIDFSKLTGDIALSSSLIDSIENVKVTGKGVMTIENLTSFNTFNDDSYFVIYLGGFHNTIRRNFINLIYKNNPNTSFYHFGDIDAGGFYILSHLRRMTNINFIPYKMDKETLMEYSDYTKKLTTNDRERLKRIQEIDFKDTIDYMLKNNCKLEQEAVTINS